MSQIESSFLAGPNRKPPPGLLDRSSTSIQRENYSKLCNLGGRKRDSEIEVWRRQKVYQLPCPSMYYPSAGEKSQVGWIRRGKKVCNNTARCRGDLMSRAVEGERGGLGNRCTLQHITRFRASETLAPGTARNPPYKVGAPLPFSLGSGTLIYPWPSTPSVDPWCVRSYISPRLSIVSSSPGKPGRRAGLPGFALEAGTFMMKP